MYAEYENYCFRCSYLLTNMSLATWAEQRKLPVKKLVGDLDYTVLRTLYTYVSYSYFLSFSFAIYTLQLYEIFQVKSIQAQ